MILYPFSNHTPRDFFKLLYRNLLIWEMNNYSRVSIRIPVKTETLEAGILGLLIFLTPCSLSIFSCHPNFFPRVFSQAQQFPSPRALLKAQLQFLRRRSLQMNVLGTFPFCVFLAKAYSLVKLLIASQQQMSDTDSVRSSYEVKRKTSHFPAHKPLSIL